MNFLYLFLILFRIPILCFYDLVCKITYQINSPPSTPRLLLIRIKAQHSPIYNPRSSLIIQYHPFSHPSQALIHLSQAPTQVSESLNHPSERLTQVNKSSQLRNQGLIQVNERFPHLSETLTQVRESLTQEQEWRKRRCKELNYPRFYCNPLFQ